MANPRGDVVMKFLIWFVTLAAVAVWSLLAWGAHALVGVAGNVASSNSDAFPLPPETIEWISWLSVAAANTGEWLIVVVWALVTGLLLALGTAASRFLPNLLRRRTRVQGL
jgi:hypothetical protein